MGRHLYGGRVFLTPNGSSLCQIRDGDGEPPTGLGRKRRGLETVTEGSARPLYQRSCPCDRRRAPEKDPGPPRTRRLTGLHLHLVSRNGVPPRNSRRGTRVEVARRPYPDPSTPHPSKPSGTPPKTKTEIDVKSSPYHTEFTSPPRVECFPSSPPSFDPSPFPSLPFDLGLSNPFLLTPRHHSSGCRAGAPWSWVPRFLRRNLTLRSPSCVSLLGTLRVGPCPYLCSDLNTESQSLSGGTRVGHPSPPSLLPSSCTS